ncbi:hypothetical protein J4456_02860 [Candidatus Pacearchaeota archaeon]|nr:hypothetical protein [Candidatus Pacearchaeota archaeon]
MRTFSFKYKGKKIFIPVEECRTIFQRGTGLMLRNDDKALLFRFTRKGKSAIHSFFCKPFIAVWFNGDEIIDVKLIKRWQIFIKPRKKFDLLLEIPTTNYFSKNFISTTS